MTIVLGPGAGPSSYTYHQRLSWWELLHSLPNREGKSCDDGRTKATEAQMFRQR